MHTLFYSLRRHRSALVFTGASIPLKHNLVQVTKVILPEGTYRESTGFGYVEFGDRRALVDALNRLEDKVSIAV